MIILFLLRNELESGVRSCEIKYNYVQLFSYTKLRITTTDTYVLLLKQQWFLSKKIFKLTKNQSKYMCIMRWSY